MNILIIISFLVQSIYSSNLVHYKFGSNFGQVFKDYSESGNHGQNGKSLNTTQSDTISIDRGAYFPTTTNYILLPPNEINSTPLSLGLNFSIVIWVYALSTSTDAYLTYRCKDSNNLISFWFITSITSLAGRIYVNGNKSEKLSSLTNTVISNNWYCVIMINSDTTATYYMNNLQILVISRTSAYTETGTYNHSIGFYSKSFYGFVWSFYLFNETVNIYDFFATTYTGNNCLVQTCPSTCSPGIREDGVNYCISTSNDVTGCSACNGGCFANACMECTDCQSNNCIYKDGTVYCVCSSSNCTCKNGYYYDQNDSICLSCYQECATCNNSLKCLSCIDSNSLPHTSVGCSCTEGYFNVTALSSSGTCLACNSDCYSCNNLLVCSVCKDTNASPHPTVGCICNQGFYNLSALSSTNSCIPCYSSCKSCNQSDLCLNCKAENSKPKNNYGCECRQGFYNLSTLEDGGICSPCNSNCLSCSEPSLCSTCVDSNAEVYASGGCRCKQGYFNVSELNTEGTCLNCNTDCESCSQENKCISCKDKNSLPHSVIGCVCKDGFYNISDLSIDGSCLECSPECKTCDQANFCLTCLNENSIPSKDYGCECIQGFFLLFNSGTCEPCHSNCKSCTEKLKCDTCIDFNSEPHSKVGCICKAGYYNSSSLDIKNSCLPCPSDCKTCSNETICTECIYSNSSPSSSGCECMKGYFNTSSLPSGGICSPCSKECLSCIDSEKCISCQDPNSSPSSLSGCDCLENFYKGESGSCLKCLTENSYFNGTSCECKENYWKDSSGSCIPCNLSCECLKNSGLPVGSTCDCQTGFYLSEKFECAPCPVDCFDCDKHHDCVKCEYENSSFQGDDCFCNEGFYFDGICKIEMFYVNISFSSIYVARIWFDHDLMEDLEKRQVSVELNGKDIRFKLVKVKMDRFDIYFDLKLMKKYNKFNVEFKSGIKSYKSATLANKNLESNFERSSEVELMIEMNRTAAEVKGITESGVVAGTSVAFGFSLLTLDPSGLFDFLNTAELFFCVNIFDLELNIILTEFLSAIRVQKKSPKLLKSFYTPQKTASLGYKYGSLGFRNEFFLLNTEPYLQTFLVFLFIFFMLQTLRKIRKISSKVEEILSLFRYSVFLRFWIQSFLEFLICSIIGLRFFRKDDSDSISNLVVCVVVLVVFIQGIQSFMIFFLFKTISNRTGLTTKEEIEKFDKMFGIFFEEFKTRSVEECLFYVFYILRRVLIVFVCAVSKNGYFQVIFSAFFTVVFIVYIIVIRPFKSRYLNIYHGLKELIVVIFYLIACFSSLSNGGMTKTSAFYCIYCVTFAWILNSVYTGLNTIKKLTQKVKKFFENRRSAKVQVLAQDEAKMFNHLRNSDTKMSQK